MSPQDPTKRKGTALIIGITPHGAGDDGPSGLRSPEDAEPDPMDMGDDTSGENCGGCKFFTADEQQCCRYPPHGTEWAMVTPDQWCGEFMAGKPHGGAAPETPEDHIAAMPGMAPAPQGAMN